MIKVSLNDILNANETFSQIMSQSFKGSLAFKIARLARELNKEVETFNTERQKLVNEYCEKDENGNFITVDNGNIKIMDDKIEDFTNDFSSLLSTEVEINAEKLPIDKIDDFNITPQQVLSLEKFFEENE